LLDRGPRITPLHNFGITPPRERWEDYLDLESTPFALFNPEGRLVCDGILADCVASASETEIHSEVQSLVAATPSARFDIGSEVLGVPGKPTLLVRDYGDYAVHANTPFAHHWQNYTLRLREAPSARIANLSRQALFWLKVNGGVSNIIVLHVRRGDKILGDSLVNGLNESTAPRNILKVLKTMAVPGTATVYIMTNEWDQTFFDEIRAEYTVFQWDDIPSLRSLIAKCPLPRSREPTATSASSDTDDLVVSERSVSAGGCDSITLYSVEEALMGLVTPSHRVMTFENDIDYRWRSGGAVAFLHPVGGWSARTERKWCKRLGETCLFHSNCCSGRCRRRGDGEPLQCFDWYPSPVLI
jgi:hypothetical protein